MIVEQLSNYYVMLKENEDARKDEGRINKPKLWAKSNEHVPNKVDNNKLIKEKKEDNQIIPKHVTIDYFCKKTQQRRLKEREQK